MVTAMSNRVERWRPLPRRRLLAAMALRQPFRGRGLVRACMLVPYVAPVVAATFVWTTMLNPQFGIVRGVAGGLTRGPARHVGRVGRTSCSHSVDGRPP